MLAQTQAWLYNQSDREWDPAFGWRGDCREPQLLHLQMGMSAVPFFFFLSIIF